MKDTRTMTWCSAALKPAENTKIVKLISYTLSGREGKLTHMNKKLLLQEHTNSKWTG